MTINNKTKEYNDMLYDTRPTKFNDLISNKYNNVHKQLFNDAINRYIESIIENNCNKALKYIVSFDQWRIPEEVIDDASQLTIDPVKYDTINREILTNQIFGASNSETPNISLAHDINTILDTEKNNVLRRSKIVKLLKKYFIKFNKILEIKNKEYWMPSTAIIINSRNMIKQKQYLGSWWNFYQFKLDKEVSNKKYLEEQLNDSEILSLNYVTGKAKMRSRLHDIEYDIDFDYLTGNEEIADEALLKNTSFGII